MRIALLADSHDRLPAVAEFARRFAEAGVELVLHAGDYCSPFALEPFTAHTLPLAGVFGRNDGDREGLLTAASLGVAGEIYESPHSVEVAGTRILVVHDIGEVHERSLDAHAIVVHGCSHHAEQSWRGATLLINPGEACGWLSGTPTAAILELETRRVELLALEGEEWAR